MIIYTANKIASFLYENNYLDKEQYEYEIYLYGFEVLIATVINILGALSIAIIFNKTSQIIMFLLFYCPLRQFAGGYHAENYRRCFFIFMGLVLINIKVANILFNYDFKIILIMISIINALSILLIAPIENTNKVLNASEIKTYKIKVRIIIIFILGFIFISSQILKIYEYFLYSILSLFWINVMLVVTFIYKRRG